MKAAYYVYVVRPRSAPVPLHASAASFVFMLAINWFISREPDFGVRAVGSLRADEGERGQPSGGVRENGQAPVVHLTRARALEGLGRASYR